MTGVKGELGMTSPWWLVRLVYETPQGRLKRFWWLSRGETRGDAGREAHLRWEARNVEDKVLRSCEVFSLDFMDSAVDHELESRR